MAITKEGNTVRELCDCCCGAVLKVDLASSAESSDINPNGTFR